MRRKLLRFAWSVLGTTSLLVLKHLEAFSLYACLISGVLTAVSVLLWYRHHSQNAQRFLLSACGMLFASILVLLWNTSVLQPAIAYDGVSETMVMTVCESPETNDGYTVFDADVIRIGTQETSMRVRVTGAEDLCVSLGDRLTVFGELHVSAEERVLYDRAKGILMRVKIRDVIEREVPDRIPVRLLPVWLSERIGEKFDALLPEHASGILSALLLGDKSGLTSSQKIDLRRTGLSHVAAVSGLHVSFLVGILMTVFHRKLGMVLSVPTLLFFAVMTGMSPSVLRAVIMQLVWICSFPLKRENDAPTAMGFAAVCILCMNPYVIGDIGFVLSFGSTLGITLWSGKITAFFLEHFPKPHRKFAQKAVRDIASTLGTTAAAQVVILPLCLGYFKETSLISPLSNLLLLGVVEILFFLGVLLAVSAFLLPFAAVFLARICEVVIWLFETVMGLLADLPFSYAAADVYIWIAVCAVYVLVGLYLIFGYEKEHAAVVLKGTVSMLAVVVSVTILCRCVTGYTNGYLLMPQMRGGQFAAMQARDVCVAVNCGGYSGVYGAEELLRLREVRDIDLMVLTDYNTTSTNGFADLAESIPVKRLVLPMPRNDQEYETAYSLGETAAAHGTKVHYLSCGEEVTAEVYAIGPVSVTCIAAGNSASDRGRLTVGLTAGDMKTVVTGNVKPETLTDAVTAYHFTDANVIAMSAYYSRNALPEKLLSADNLLVTTGYDGLEQDALSSLTERDNVILPDYESVVLRFGL